MFPHFPDFQPGNMSALQHCGYHCHIDEGSGQSENRNPTLQSSRRKQQTENRRHGAHDEEKNPRNFPRVDRLRQCRQSDRRQKFEETEIQKNLHRESFSCADLLCAIRQFIAIQSSKPDAAQKRWGLRQLRRAHDRKTQLR